MVDKYFPIKTKTACQSKWTWSTITLFDGTTNSCHRVDHNTITPETFSNFHNTPKKLADRQLMLNGQWPGGGCEYCKHIEDAGGHSDRMLHLGIPNLVPKELDVNPTAITVTPKILEVYFDNVCNMSCIYCKNIYSSKIDQENQRFGTFEKYGVKIQSINVKTDRFEELTNALWAWMELNAHELVRFQVLGGEPFYQAQFDRCLDFFETHPCPNLEFNVISNIMVSSQRFQTIIQRIKKLVARRKVKRFDLTCSIDGFDAGQEYVRYGLKLEQWRENFEYAVKEKWIYLNFNQTLSGLILKGVPELLRYINEQRQHREIHHHFGTPAMTYNFLHPDIFGPGYFDSVFEEILTLMPAETEQQKTAREYMLGIQRQVNSQLRNQTAINQLGVYLDEMDRRRGLNWRQAFPWLVKEIEHVV